MALRCPCGGAHELLGSAQWQWQSDCPVAKVKRDTQRDTKISNHEKSRMSTYEKEISLPDMNVVVGSRKA